MVMLLLHSIFDSKSLASFNAIYWYYSMGVTFLAHPVCKILRRLFTPLQVLTMCCSSNNSRQPAGSDRPPRKSPPNGNAYLQLNRRSLYPVFYSGGGGSMSFPTGGRASKPGGRSPTVGRGKASVGERGHGTKSSRSWSKMSVCYFNILL